MTEFGVQSFLDAAIASRPVSRREFLQGTKDLIAGVVAAQVFSARAARTSGHGLSGNELAKDERGLEDLVLYLHYGDQRGNSSHRTLRNYAEELTRKYESCGGEVAKRIRSKSLLLTALFYGEEEQPPAITVDLLKEAQNEAKDTEQWLYNYTIYNQAVHSRKRGDVTENPNQEYTDATRLLWRVIENSPFSDLESLSFSEMAKIALGLNRPTEFAEAIGLAQAAIQKSRGVNEKISNPVEIVKENLWPLLTTNVTEITLRDTTLRGYALFGGSTIQQMREIADEARNIGRDLLPWVQNGTMVFSLSKATLRSSSSSPREQERAVLDWWKGRQFVERRGFGKQVYLAQKVGKELARWDDEGKLKLPYVLTTITCPHCSKEGQLVYQPGDYWYKCLSCSKSGISLVL